ncbi:MAG: hypothetical protein IJP61_08695 [Treponema sp.]|nr:hypothetical protein [Treponema sp.]MBR0032350.1 hypothetical protein [Treponema sp.]
MRNEKKMYENSTQFPATAQERAVFNIWKKNRSDTGINLAFAFRAGNLDIRRLENAVNKIVSRHGALRSVFFEQAGCVFRKVFDEIRVEIELFESDDLRKFIRPFALENGPLFRIAVRKDIVCLDFCHIITDGFSMAIFFSELNAFYSGKDLLYKPSPIHSEDFNTIQKNTDFWVSQFKRPFKNLAVSFDKKKSTGNSNIYGGDGSSLVSGVGKRLTKKVRLLCQKLSVTPFIFYFSAFIIFLSRECSSKDVVTTTNFSCRNSHNLRLFGLLATTAPIRFFVDEQMSAFDFIRNMNEYIRDCLSHQNFDSEKLIESCGFSDLRDFSRTVFTYEHAKMADIRLDNKPCEFVPIPSRHSEADFTLCFFPFKNDGKILFIFRADLFSHIRARELLRHYLSVIKNICDEIKDCANYGEANLP